MAKNDLVEAPLGVPAAKPLLKRRCQSDVSTPNQMEILFIYLFIHSIAQYIVSSTFACKSKTSRVRMTAVYRGAPAVESVKVCKAPDQKQSKAPVNQLKGDVGSDSAAKTPTAPLPSTSQGKSSAFASLIIRSAFKTLLFALQRGEPDLTFAARFPSATIALGAAPLALLGQLCTFMRSVFFLYTS